MMQLRRTFKNTPDKECDLVFEKNKWMRPIRPKLNPQLIFKICGSKRRMSVDSRKMKRSNYYIGVNSVDSLPPKKYIAC